MRSIASVLASFMICGFTLAATAGAPNKDAVVAINDAFVPTGFDSHMDAFVIVSGIFPNGCYKWKAANVRHVSAVVHLIESVASVSQGECIMVLIPFSKDVHLGQLQSGNHTLRFVSNDGTFLEKILSIR